MEANTYQDTTESIEIIVNPYYLSEKSVPEKNYYFFAYKIKITNLGLIPAKLMSRHWIIKDGHGQEDQVVGDGVVGEHPHLSTGQSFTYTSFCPLTTRTGNMRGKFHMLSDTGKSFVVNVPLFFFQTPLS